MKKKTSKKKKPDRILINFVVTQDEKDFLQEKADRYNRGVVSQLLRQAIFEYTPTYPRRTI